MGKLRKKINRHLFFTEEYKRIKLIDNPPEIDDRKIVITSSPDYSGNSKALFLYMIEHGYNEKYKITWLFEDRNNFRDFEIENVESINMFNSKGNRTEAAQRAILSAKYIFYTHNVNWAKAFNKNQKYINLWHGCGYKGDLLSDKRKIYYDYLMVTGPHYIDIFRKVLKNENGNILALGYPRNDLLRTHRSKAQQYVEELKINHLAEKMIMWMPTYRSSRVKRLSIDTNLGEIGIPIITNYKKLQEMDDYCNKLGIIILLKQHFLQENLDLDKIKLKNIILLSDKELLDKDIDLYELMAQSDALITDYSSVAIDYMLLNKPLAYTLDDYDDYEDARGWSFDNVKDYMPGHHTYNTIDLQNFLADIDKEKDLYAEDRKEVRKSVLTESDCYSKDILQYFEL